MKKLLSLNIEAERHLARVRPFIEVHHPDVICLQEVFKCDIEGLVGTDYHSEFLPMCLKTRHDGSESEWGIAIASRAASRRVTHVYYHKPTNSLVVANDSTLEAKRATYWHGVLGLTVEDESGDLRLFTTHFTWTPNGLSNEYQAIDMERMLECLSQEEPHVFCGDFNLPRRQNTLYPLIASRYTDHIPAVYKTSMYLPLHRVKDIPESAAMVGSYMVDYIFSSPGAYSVRDVSLAGEVSDHYAVIGTIEKTA